MAYLRCLRASDFRSTVKDGIISKEVVKIHDSLKEPVTIYSFSSLNRILHNYLSLI